MQERLTVVRPAGLGEALADAVAHVCAVPLNVTPGHVQLLDARLACGDFESIRTLLRTALPSSALPLFVARYARWSGDLQSVAAAWNDVLASLDDLLSSDSDPHLRRATCAELAATATDLGDAQLAARLHAVARRQPEPVENRDAPTPADPAARLICDIAFNVFGVEPDAVRGRLRLRPAMHTHDALHARNIRFGDATVSLNAARTAGTLTIRVEQDAGSIPVTVLLEPIVPRRPADPDDTPGGTDPADPSDVAASRSAAITAEIDGQPAELSPRYEERSIIVPVQLVLDDARTLVIQSIGDTPARQARS